MFEKSKSMKFPYHLLLTSVFLFIYTHNVTAETEEGEGRGSVTHGNISGQGPTGMFQNPTARMLDDKELILQYCVFITESNNNENLLTHKAIASYGVTEWLELGLRGQVVDQDRAAVGDRTLTSAGGFFRLRAIEEEGFIPVISIGGVTADGGIGGNEKELTKHNLFAAASKGLGLKERGCPIDMTFHIGYRNQWDNGGAEEATAYLGGEIELPNHIYFVSEVSTKRDPARAQHHTPYSLGIQVRHPDGVSLTLAAAQNGRQNELGWFVGVGINFD